MMNAVSKGVYSPTKNSIKERRVNSKRRKNKYRCTGFGYCKKCKIQTCIRGTK